MYNPLSSCSAFVHLLIKHPVLIVGLGLVGAVNFLTPQLNNRSIKKTEQSVIFRSEIQKLKANPIDAKLAKQAGKAFKAIVANELGTKIPSPKCPSPKGPSNEEWFTAIKKVESGNRSLGKHLDGVSYGPAGLTKGALKDVLEEIPSCQDLNFDEILNDPEMSTKFAYLYFLKLVRKFKNIEIAVVAYNNGPTRVSRWLRRGKKLPHGYLDKVKRYLKD